MRAGGAIALLLGGINNNKIKLVGRWNSDEMMASLHVSYCNFFKSFNGIIVDHSDYSQIPTLLELYD